MLCQVDRAVHFQALFHSTCEALPHLLEELKPFKVIRNE